MGTLKKDLSVKIFSDGANIADIIQQSANPLIKGFTTNPTLMRQADVKDYEAFAKKALAAVPNHPLSLEVFADDIDQMHHQAKIISTWGENVNIKIPVTNTKQVFTGPIIQQLSSQGVSLNITAVMTVEQVKNITAALDKNTPAIISVFAGRIADTGINPIPIMEAAPEIIAPYPNVELLWASPREVLNVYQANDIGCHIITITNSLLKKLSLFGKNLDSYSKETVEMFYTDACTAGYKINPPDAEEHKTTTKGKPNAIHSELL